MTSLEQHLLWIDGHMTPLSEAFYGGLFRTHPHIKSLFGVASRAAGKQMLRQILSSVLQLDEPWVRDELADTGRRHRADLEIPVEMYAMVQQALLAALEEVSGERWTPELATAWNEKLDAVTAATLENA